MKKQITQYIKPFLICISLSIAACSQQDVYTSQPDVEQRYTDNVIKASDISHDGEFTLWSDGEHVCLWNNPNNKGAILLKRIRRKVN